MREMLLFFISCLLSASAFAHPMGNYSINQYWLVDGRGEALAIYYLIDIAEVPALKELDRLDPDFDGSIKAEDREKYLDERIPEFLEKISITANLHEIPVKVSERTLSIIPGMGGMEVVHILLRLETKRIPWPPTEDEPVLMDLNSENFPTSTGTRECKVVLDGVYGDQSEGLGDALRYQKIFLWDENLNPQYQDYDAQFLVKIGVSNENIEVENPTELSFAWTTTARLAKGAGERGIVESLSTPIVPRPAAATPTGR